MKVLFIRGERSGYGPEQCPETVTVGELIDILREYDPETCIYLKNDSGYTYGHIDPDYFEEDDVEVSRQQVDKLIDLYDIEDPDDIDLDDEYDED
jgi:hypothetical protein